MSFKTARLNFCPFFIQSWEALFLVFLLLTLTAECWLRNLLLYSHWADISAHSEIYPLHKKWSFPCRISSVNVTKSAVFCGFGHIYWRKPSWKTSFFLQLMNYIHPKAYLGHSQTSIMELFFEKMNSSNRELFSQKSSRDHSFSTYARFSEKLIFCTPRYLYVHVPMRIRG